jgi:hypothetical protein
MAARFPHPRAAAPAIGPSPAGWAATLSTDDFAPRRPPVPGVNDLLTIIILIPLTKPPPGRR